METSVVIILLTLIASAFFSGLEIAFITSNKLRIELENKQGNFSAKILSYFNKYPSRYLGTMLLGNNIALVIFGIYMDEELQPIIGNFVTSRIAVFFINNFFYNFVYLVLCEIKFLGGTAQEQE